MTTHPSGGQAGFAGLPPAPDHPSRRGWTHARPGPQGAPPRRRRRGDRRTLWAAPALGFLTAFFVYPLYLLFDTSTREVSLGSAGQSGLPSVGMSNYSAVFASKAFQDAVPRTLVFLLATVAIQLVVGLLLALTLHQRYRWMVVPRLLVYFVWLLPPVVSGAVWKFALDGTAQGAVNAALTGLGLTGDPILFLTNPTLALAAIVAVNAWAGVPFVAIIFAAALNDVPLELYEAAKVDGAGPLRRFWSVTWPSIGPTVGVLSALLVIYSFKAFDYIFVLTGGGPGTSTSTVPFLSYLVSFTQFDFGVGSAIGSLSVAFALLCASPYIWRVWKERNA